MQASGADMPSPDQLRVLWTLGSRLGAQGATELFGKRAIDDFVESAMQIRARLDSVRLQSAESGSMRKHGSAAAPAASSEMDAGLCEQAEDEEDAGWDEQPCERGLYELLSTAGAWLQQVAQLDASAKARAGVAARLHEECARHAADVLVLCSQEAGLPTGPSAAAAGAAAAGAQSGGRSVATDDPSAAADRAAFALQLTERYLRVAGAALGRGGVHEPSRAVAAGMAIGARG